MWEIYSLLAWQWWLQSAIFGVAILISWFMPGLVLLSYTRLSKSTQIVIAPIFGLCVWTLMAYFLGWLDLRVLIYVVLLGFGFWLYKRRRVVFPLAWKLKLPPIIWLLMVIGIILQLIPVWGSGWQHDQGIIFYFVNIFDGVFHLSLARSLVESVPPVQPGAVGLPVTNYHYLSNLAIAQLTATWKLPLIHLYFQFVPTFLSLWLGLLVVTLLKKWSTNIWTLIFGLVFFYGVGEISWLVDVILGRNSSVPFEVFIDHGVLQFLNPPQAFAKAVFIAVLILLNSFWKKRSLIMALIIGSMIATLVGFKVYFGFAAGLGLAASVGWLMVQDIIRYRDSRKLLSIKYLWHEWLPWVILFAVAGLIGALIYLPTNTSAGGIFFDFLTWPKLLLGATKLNWNEWWLRLQVYQAAGNLKALTVWYSLAAGIFLLAIYHLRLIGLAALFPKLRQQMQTPEVIFLGFASVVSTLLGMNFLQTSGGSNIFNFMVVALTMLNLLTAVVLGKLAEKRALILPIIALLVITLVQTYQLQAFFLTHYRNGTDSQTVSPAHQAGFQYLASLPTDTTVIQTFPRHYFDETTPYLYFFTGQRTYFGGRGILDSHNQPVQDRRKNMDLLFAEDATISAVIARELNISHILLQHPISAEELRYKLLVTHATLSAKPRWRVSFNNDEVAILELLKPPQNDEDDWLMNKIEP